MGKERLKGKRVAILATDGFEESELCEPMEAIKSEGGIVDIVSIKSGDIKAWKDGNWSQTYKVNKELSEVSAQEYDGLVLPGGVINPDLLRKNSSAVSFVKDFFNSEKQKPVAAICHGPWMLAEANVMRDRSVTSYDSIKTDLLNAGAKWKDMEVVVDKGLVTSRSPDDLPVFCNKLIEEMCEGTHQY